MTQKDFQVSTGLPPQPYTEEWKRSCPNYLVYHPAPDGNPRWHDDDFFLLNEHFIVQSTSDDHLLATWTAHGPACRFRRVVTARSNDGGKNWTEPQIVDGGPDTSASWSVPVVSSSGRVYLLYSYYPSEHNAHGGACCLAWRFSDDGIPVDAVGNEPRYEAAAYGSLTEDEDGYILWYPDRKHYLVGKRIPDTLDIF